MHWKVKLRRFPYTRAFAFLVLFDNRTFRHFVFTHIVNRCATRTTKTEIPEVPWLLSLPGKRKIGRNSEKALLKSQRSVDGDYFPFVTSWSCQKLLKENFSEILKLFRQQRWVPVVQRTKQLVCLLWRVVKDIVIVSFEKYLLQLCKVNLTLKRNCQQIPFFPMSLVWATSLLSKSA